MFSGGIKRGQWHEMVMKTRQCQNVRYRKKQVFLLFYHQFAIKTKKIQHIIFEIFPQKNSLQNLKWAL